jgi:hypothetical protein
MTSSNAFVSSQQKNRQLVSFLICTLAALSLVATNSSAQTTSSRAPGWVVLALSDYRSLHARAYPPDREPEAPPVDATLTRVDYDLRIDGDLAAGRATLTVDVLKDGWVRVPIPAGLLVREAKLDGRLVSLVPGAAGKGTNQLCALLSRPGRSVLQLDIALSVLSTAGEESISLPSTASGVTRATVHLPRQGVDIRLTGGLLADKSYVCAAHSPNSPASAKTPPPSSPRSTSK